MCCPRGRGLVENEEHDENEMMKSIVVEEQEEEEGSEGESETGFVDLDQDTLLNVLERVDAVTLARAACVNKLWRNVSRANRLWEPMAIRVWVGSGWLERIDEIRNRLRWWGFQCPFHFRHWILRRIAKPPPSDFYSIDPQVFSSQIGPWVQN